MNCTSCNHIRVCIFRTKLTSLTSQYTHLFNPGFTSATNGIADYCRYYRNEVYVPEFRIESWEEEAIKRAIEVAKDRDEAAMLLGMPIRTLQRRIKKYGLKKRREAK